ncbi:MAG: class I SAM-dependent methyltransferase [Parvularculaceae bacterium]
MKKISQCRACGSTSLRPAFVIESAAASAGGDVRRGEANLARGLFGGEGFAASGASAYRYVRCDSGQNAEACGLVQNERLGAAPMAPPPSGLYRSNRSHLRAVATEALELVSGRDCAALDIGCSDGTLLSFYPRWVERYGVDRADVVEQIGAWAWRARAAFPSIEIDRALGDRKFDIVTAISVLEEVDEPRAFLARIKALLAPDGVLALETLYAPMTLTRTSVEAVMDGKAALYSLGALERLLRECDLKIFRGAVTDKNGGSVRLFACHADVDAYDFDPWYERLARLWDEENALALHMPAPYQAFQGRAEEARAAFADFMVAARRRGEVAHIVGAGEAAREIFHWAGPGVSAIEAAVAPNDVAGDAADGARLCPGGPPLVSEAESRALEPDYFIAPSALKREMLERWREPILRGATFLFPTPTPHIVDAGNYAAELGKSLADGDGAGGVETLRAILSAAGGLRVVADAGARKRA